MNNDKNFDWKPIIETLKNLGSQEDWFTECIKLALCYNKELAYEFVERLFSRSGNNDKLKNIFPDLSKRQIVINSQVSQEGVIFDLVINIDHLPENNHFLIIEVKRGAPISKNKKEDKCQLEKYIKNAQYVALIGQRWYSKDEIKIYDKERYLHPENENNYLWCQFYDLFAEFKEQDSLSKFIVEEVMKEDRLVDLKIIREYLMTIKNKGKEALSALPKDPRIRNKLCEIAREIGATDLVEGGWSGYKIKKEDREIFIGFNHTWVPTYTKEIRKKYAESLRKYIIEVPQARNRKKFEVNTPCFFVYEKRNDIKSLEPSKDNSEGVNIYFGKAPQKNKQKCTYKVVVFNILDIVDRTSKEDDFIDKICRLLEKSIKIVLR